MTFMSLHLKVTGNDNFVSVSEDLKQVVNAEPVQTETHQELAEVNVPEIETANVSVIDVPEPANDNSNDDPDPNSPNSGALRTGNKDETLSQEQIAEAVSAYKVQEMVTLVPPEKYKRTGKVSLSASITRLRYELALKPFLLSIRKRPGAHPGKGIPSKAILVKNLYGLGRYACEQIENLEAEWVEAAIKRAKEYNEPATRILSFNLKKEFEQKAKEAERCLKQAERNQKFAERVENSKKANVAEAYNAAIVDLTQMPNNCIPETLTLPLAENALVLVAVMPAKLLDAIDLIKKWGLTYVDNIVWNRNRIKGQYVWSKNIHTNILIATKGSLEKPIEYFRFDSNTFEHQGSDQKYLPDYYFSEVEVLVPGGKYLEVFTARQYSDQWFSYQAQGGKNV